MAKLYKPLVLTASILLLAFLMQFLRDGSLQLNHALTVSLLFAAGAAVALLIGYRQPKAQQL